MGELRLSAKLTRSGQLLSSRNASQRRGQLTTETHLDCAPIGLKFGTFANGVGHAIREHQRRQEHPSNCVEKPTHRAPHRCERRRVADKRSSGSDRNVLQEETDPGQQEDRQAQPPPKGERHGVQPQVMRNLVSQHTSHLVSRQLFEGKRGDHQQTSATGKGVEIVGWQHRQREPTVRDRQLLGNAAPCRFESFGLLGRGPPRAQHAHHQDLLQRPPEHKDHSPEVQRSKCRKTDVPPEVHRPPEHGERHQPHGDDGHNRQDRCKGRRFDRTLGATRTSHAVLFVRRWWRVLNGSQSRALVASTRPTRRECGNRRERRLLTAVLCHRKCHAAKHCQGWPKKVRYP